MQKIINRDEKSYVALVTFTIIVSIYWLHRVLNWKRPKQGQIDKDEFPPGTRSCFEGVKALRHFLLTDNLNCLPQLGYYEQKFGKMMGLCGLFKKGVIISDIKALKEAYTNPAILGRVPLDFFQMYEDGHYRGFGVRSGEAWHELRRFTMTQLKSYGVGHKMLGPTIMREVQETIDVLRENAGKPFSTKFFFDIPAFNILWQIISSQRFSYKDPEAACLIEAIGATFSSHVLLIFMFLLPRLTKLVLWLFGANFVSVAHKRYLKLLGSLVEERKADYENNQRKDDFVDKFLEKIESTTDPTSEFYGRQGYENLAETIRDLFVGGTQTTASTISWALLYLALHPEKQKKIQKEIDQVLGEKLPTLFDKQNMLYTEAVINETLRRSSHIPMGIMHVATEDTALGQYKLPKDTVVISNVYAIHHCEKTWTDPYKFRPERFLNEDESALVKYEAFIPFGIGKRMCPGTNLARDELFLFLTGIFQELNVTWNPLEKKPDMDCKIGITFVPKPHTLIFKRRN